MSDRTAPGDFYDRVGGEVAYRGAAAAANVHFRWKLPIEPLEF
jgi:hypothetical protein